LAPDLTFILDASSFQGAVDWAQADGIIRAGFEKCTEGTGYVNPYWPAAKTGMLARASADGLIPGVYLFADAGPGAAQADWFAAHAGDLAGFAIAVDFERSATTPALATAQEIVTRLRQLYPSRPVGLYAPQWFTGGEDLSFGDWLWASSYVVTTARAPAAVYGDVPASYWTAYGGVTPDVLQFTDAAVIPGVPGLCDCSAYRGTLAGLASVLLPATQAPSVQEDTDMADSLSAELFPGEPVIFPVWAGAAPGEPPAYRYAALQVAATAVTTVIAVFEGEGHTVTQPVTVPAGTVVTVTPGKPLTWSDVSTITLTRAAVAVSQPAVDVRAVLTRWQ